MMSRLRSFRLPTFRQLAWIILVPCGMLAVMCAQPRAVQKADCVATPSIARSARPIPTPNPYALPGHRGARVQALIVPVQGITRNQLTDTWGAARADGQTHQGIDIMAAQGTPVYAVTDGRIAKFFDSARGGTTIYEFDRNERYVYYYAHLSSRALGLKEGDDVRQGQIIGFVGQTGNATTPHLHFEIERLNDAREWWRAEAINPYPFLRAGRLPN